MLLPIQASAKPEQPAPRRGFWRTISVLIGATMSLALTPVVLAAAPPVSTLLDSNTTAATLSTLTMVNPTTGWAFDRDEIVRTTNGGRQWTSVTPTGLTIRKNLQSGTLNTLWDFVSTKSAWVAEQPTSSGTVHFWYTDNGGQRWIEHTHTFAPLAKSPNTAITTIDFLNRNQGWIGWGLGLWETENGGQSWHREVITQTAMPTSATVTFTSPTTGWAVVPDEGKVTSGFFIYRSTNQGTSWQTMSIIQVPGLYALATPPTFSGKTGLLAGYRSNANALVALRTIEGGQQWTALSPAVANTLSSSDSWGMQTLGGTSAWAIAEGRLWRYTSDSNTWTYRSADRFFAHASGIDFINAQVGWVWKANKNGITRIWMTTSGGTHWTTWTPALTSPTS